jgi:hypothetical protein
MNMKKTARQKIMQVRVNPIEYALLNAISNKEGVSLSEIVRNSIKFYGAKRGINIKYGKIIDKKDESQPIIDLGT